MLRLLVILTLVLQPACLAAAPAPITEDASGCCCGPAACCASACACAPSQPRPIPQPKAPAGDLWNILFLPAPTAAAIVQSGPPRAGTGPARDEPRPAYSSNSERHSLLCIWRR